MGLTHGGKKLLEALRADEADALGLLDLAAERIRYNPDFAVSQIRKAQDLIRHAARERDERLPPMIQRGAPPLEQRIEELERWRAEIERTATIRPIRKEA